MLWRYGRTILTSIPVAAAIGALLGVAMYLFGNSEYRSHGGWGTFGYWVALGAGFGVVTALPAVLEAIITLALTGRSLPRTPTAERVKAGGWGAAAGALAVWVVVTALSAPWTSGLGLFLTIGFVAAGTSGIAAAVLIRWTEARHRK